MSIDQTKNTELLNPLTFTAPTLPSHYGLPFDRRPVFMFKVRSWRQSVELDETLPRLRKAKTDGQCAKLIVPLIRDFLVLAKSADINRLTCKEVMELFTAMRLGEIEAMKSNCPRPPSRFRRLLAWLKGILFCELNFYKRNTTR